MNINAKDVMALRKKTGAGMMECKKALTETAGDIEKAMDLLRKKGIAYADKRSGRATKNGYIAVYVHTGAQVAAMVELNCETDFVARNDKFQECATNIAMHVVAANPLALSSDDIDKDVVEKEKEIYRGQALNEGKKPEFADKIIEGRLKKFYAENCLLDQIYVKDETKKITIGDLLKTLITTTGENINISRFIRYQVGG